MGLLQKEEQKNLIDRKEDIQPKSTFSRNSLFATSEPEGKPVSKKIKEKQTTMRVAESTALEVKSMMLLTDSPNVNDMLVKLIEHYHTDLSIDEQAELKQIKKVIGKGI